MNGLKLKKWHLVLSIRNVFDHEKLGNEARLKEEYAVDCKYHQHTLWLGLKVKFTLKSISTNSFNSIIIAVTFYPVMLLGIFRIIYLQDCITCNSSLKHWLYSLKKISQLLVQLCWYHQRSSFSSKIKKQGITYTINFAQHDKYKETRLAREGRLILMLAER